MSRGRTLAAILLGLVLATLPFVHYRCGGGHHGGESVGHLDAPHRDHPGD